MKKVEDKAVHISHENLEEWMRSRGITWERMEDIAHRSSLYRFRKNNLPMPTDAIIAWADHFQWSPEQAWHLCFDGAPPKQSTEAEDMKKVLGQLADILAEVAS